PSSGVLRRSSSQASSKARRSIPSCQGRLLVRPRWLARRQLRQCRPAGRFQACSDFQRWHPRLNSFVTRHHFGDIGYKEKPAPAVPARVSQIKYPKNAWEGASSGYSAFKSVRRGVLEVFERDLGLRHEGRKSLRLVDGHVGQHLAVDLDAGLVEAVDEAAIAQAVLAGGGVDALDPERAERALADLAVAIGVLQRLLDRLLGDANGVLAAAVKALGGLQDLLVLGVAGRASFYAHVMISLYRSQPAQMPPPLGRKFLMTFLASGSARTMVPRASRMNLLERLIMPWRLPAAADRTFPVAVILNRFLAADLVFILGILLILIWWAHDYAEIVFGPTKARKANETATACPAGRFSGTRGLYGKQAWRATPMPMLRRCAADPQGRRNNTGNAPDICAVSIASNTGMAIRKINPSSKVLSRRRGLKLPVSPSW